MPRRETPVSPAIWIILVVAMIAILVGVMLTLLFGQDSRTEGRVYLDNPISGQVGFPDPMDTPAEGVAIKIWCNGKNYTERIEVTNKNGKYKLTLSEYERYRKKDQCFIEPQIPPSQRVLTFVRVVNQTGEIVQAPVFLITPR